jgi:hypothetical protein
MGAQITTPTRRAMIKTGQYTGDGTDNRNIDIGVNLAAKTNVTIIIYRANLGQVQFKWELGQGDETKPADGDEEINRIQALTSTGFQVGSDATVNASGFTYRYQIIWME